MKWPRIHRDCDPEIARAVNTFLTVIRVNDVLVRISRKIRARKGKASGSYQDWWPHLRLELLVEVVEPLLIDLNEFRLAGGYAADAALGVLEEIVAYLQRPDTVHPPRERSDMQLVDEYLQPVFEALQLEIAPDEYQQFGSDTPNGGRFLHELTRRTLREWFAQDGGVELGLRLHCAGAVEFAGHFVDDDIAQVLFEKYRKRLLNLPANQSRAESPRRPKSSSRTDRKSKRRLRWNASGIEAVRTAVSLAHRRTALRDDKAHKELRRGNVYFCELCDRLTQKVTNHGALSTDGVGSARYCENHALSGGTLYQRDHPRKTEFEWLHHLVLREAEHDRDFRRRLTESSNESLARAFEHTNLCQCFLCSDKENIEIIMPSDKDFVSLMAFHANARKIAYALAQAWHDSGAIIIDGIVQRGSTLAAAGESACLNAKEAGQRNGLAIARLLHQGTAVPKIAARLGISERAVYQRKAGFRGSYDFSPGRSQHLTWWPFGALAEPNTLTFSRVASKWRHCEDEYDHLALNARNHRRVASPLSLPTRSSARR